MSGSGKAGNGRGNNRKRPFRRRDKDNSSNKNSSSARNDPSQRGSAGTPGSSAEAANRAFGQGRGGFSKKGGESPREKTHFIERPKWVPPKLNTDPLPVPDCPWCGKPIRDISQAIADKDTGAPVHFDCVAARIAEGENLEKGDVVTYIGGGRFGIVCFGNPGSQSRDSHGGDFRIKKIVEWENKDKRAEWRSEICDHYSVT